MRKVEQQPPKKQLRSERRRRFERVPVDLVNWYSVIEDDCIRQGYARICDLSASGARISSASEFVRGSEISLRFTLSSGQREVYATGRIVMSFFDGPTQAHLHGVAFTRISTADQHAIARYVHDALLSDASTFDHLVTQWTQSFDVSVRGKKQSPDPSSNNR